MILFARKGTERIEERMRKRAISGLGKILSKNLQENVLMHRNRRRGLEGESERHMNGELKGSEKREADANWVEVDDDHRRGRRRQRRQQRRQEACDERQQQR